MKEMVYTSEHKREVLDTGYFHGFFYYILNLGTHPTAYIRIPENHKYYQVDYDEVDVDVHGGLTYGKDYLHIENDVKIDGWFIGWDYGHAGDYMGYYADEIFNLALYKDDDKKWTTEEIAKEVRDVCYQLAKM